MSNEERNDEMSEEETSDVEEPEAPEEPEEDIAEEPEADEDEYAYAAEVPSDGGGSSAGIWVIIVLVIAALIGLGYYQINRAALERVAEERQERQEIRANQLAAAVRGIPEAQEALERGDIDSMIASLKQVDDMLQIIATAASHAGDTGDAQRITEMRAVVTKTIKDLEPAYLELQRQRDELQKTARTRLEEILQKLAHEADPALEPEVDLPPVDEEMVEEAVDEEEPVEDEPPVDEEIDEDPADQEDVEDVAAD